ncbi:MAG: hypothetical protein L6R40_007002 [Gallowayella cf. fulva]|nr:MAG: hypothetical protein L6R40_007002 [Xanthomendoza cf. fulva]
MTEVLEGAQRGLLTHALYGQLLTVHLKNSHESTHKSLLSLVRELAATADSQQPRCGLLVGFSPTLWGKWNHRSISISDKVLNGTDQWMNTHGDVILYLKTHDHDTAEQLLEGPKRRLDGLAKVVDCVVMGKRQDSRIMGGRYHDGITNPNDPVSLRDDILINGEYKGASFAFTQRFLFDWEAITSNTSDSQNQIVGRRTDGSILSQHSTRGHIHRANVRDSNGDQRKILRQALPFGRVGHHAGREEGIMFVALCNEQQRFEDILQNLLGTRKDDAADKLMQMVSGVGGSYWYVPAAKELGVSPAKASDDLHEHPHWKVSSPNGYLFYNFQDYLHAMGEGRYKEGDAPSPRLLSLIARTFNHWRDGWVHKEHLPRLPHLAGSEDKKREMEAIPIPTRKAMANFETLTNLLSAPDSKFAQEYQLLRNYPKELIVGVVPDFTYGRGKEVMPYLSKDEEFSFWLKKQLNEFSSMGHIIPDLGHVVRNGLGKMIQEAEKRLHEDESHATFYQSAITSLQGVQGYLRNWATIADKSAAQARERDEADDADNMADVSDRLRRLVDQPPQSFQDGVQLVFSFHCCLHLVGELTSIGRLDQILWPLLEKHPIPTDRAQEIIDCLFVKIGEDAFINRSFIHDYVTCGTGSINGGWGNFSQGGGINQWGQQVTLGGYKAADGEPQDGSNPVTLLFLKAARRVPVNAPSVSLRVNKYTPADVIEEAAKALLSGGAQPCLFNDDKICKGLVDSGARKDHVKVEWARDYAADGCFEPMVAGATEFAFNNVMPLLALEQTINEGATYGAAGSEHLRGLKASFRSPLAQSIETFDDLQRIFLEQLRWLTIQSFDYMLDHYGNLADVCPSPLLSTVIDGCMEKGRDLTDGGARVHMIAPLFPGVANTIDSLYAIWKLVYEDESACTTLDELLLALINDWGFGMIEPYQDLVLAATEAEQNGDRYKELRTAALALPKWATGAADPMLKKIGADLMDSIVEISKSVIREPHPLLAPKLETIRKKYGPDFDFVVTIGTGTFEGYTGVGAACGASADGRRKGMPVASDTSPAPSPQDLPPQPTPRNIYGVMKSYHQDAVEYGIADAAPVDLNIPEDFPLEDLRHFIKDYAAGWVGGNLITLTCADTKTLQEASKDPEKYGLVRVRMGGWTEFYATSFPAHQEQHQRRLTVKPGRPDDKGYDIRNGGF